MSSLLPPGSSGLAPVSQTQIPADIQKAGPKAEQLYSTAVDFEQMLLQQLTQEIQSTTGSDGSDDGTDESDDSSDGSDGTTNLMTQMLPQAFAQGLTSAGGIGIARELYNSFAAQAGIDTAPASADTGTAVAPASTTSGSSGAPEGGPQ
jgi:Rod binding domain-containing protein